jgi:hypothetical protein
VEDIQLLNEDNWDDFDCGVHELNEFLKYHADDYVPRGVCRIWVVCHSGTRRIAAYYASSAGSLVGNLLPRSDQAGLPGFPMPTVLLGQLARCKSYETKGVGLRLIAHFLDQAVAVSERIGVFAVELVALDDRLVEYYRDAVGFHLLRVLRNGRTHMYMLMDEVREVLRKADE